MLLCRNNDRNTSYVIERENIIAFILPLSDGINWLGIVNRQNEVICSFISRFSVRALSSQDFIKFFDLLRQVIVLDIIVSYEGSILLKAHKIIPSGSGFHLFVDLAENKEKRWKIFSPDHTIIDVDVPFSNQRVTKGFNNGVLLLGSTLISQDGMTLLKGVYDFQYNEEKSVFLVEDEDTRYHKECVGRNDGRSGYRIIFSKDRVLLFGAWNVWDGRDDSYVIIDNYSLKKELGVKRVGVANPDFSIHLPMIFEEVSSYNLSNPDWWIIKVNSYYGILSRDCKSWIVKPIYDFIEYDPIGVFVISESSSKCIANLNGDVLFQTKDEGYKDLYFRNNNAYSDYIFISLFDDELNVKSCVVSYKRGEIIPPLNGWIVIPTSPLHANRFFFRESGEVVVKDIDGYELFPGKRVIKYKGGFLGLLDEVGRVILKPCYSAIFECCEDDYPPYYRAKLDLNWFFYDFSGESLLPYPCTYISWHSGGFARFIVGGSIASNNVHDGRDIFCQTSVADGKFGIYSVATRQYTKQLYDYIGEMKYVEDKFMAEACLCGVWGIINGRLEFTPLGKFEREIPSMVIISNEWIGEEPDQDYGYTEKDLEDMYRAAHEWDPEAVWNTD